ncbi:MAG: hypothetical protein ACM3NT_00080 [Methylocystaceae bacterium]
MKNGKVTLVLLLAVLLVAFSAIPAWAWQTRQPSKEGTSGSVAVKSGEVINDDLFLAGENVRIDGTVNGDVVVFGNQVDINGTVNGDLLVGGNIVNIAGTVNDDLRLGAQNARISGNIKRNLSAGASQLIIDKAASVGGNAALGAEELGIDGLIRGGLQAGAGQLSLTGKIGQNAAIQTDNLNVMPGAVIGGSLSYRGANKGNISPQAKIGGPVTYKYFIPQHQKEQPQSAIWTGILIWTLVWFVSLLLVWLIWFYLNPRSFFKVEDALINTPWASLGWGFAILILLPIAAVIAMITVVGIPIALAALTVYSGILFAGKLIVGFGLVRFLAAKYNWANLQKPFAAAAVGTLSLMLLNLIPEVGFFITLVVVMMALGSVFMALKRGLASRGVSAA